jgi:type II secretory pathway pseudopilin PulG
MTKLMTTTKAVDVTRRRGNRVADQRGFTLLEALIAVVILIFGLVAVAQLLATAAGSNALANRGTAAAAEASEQLERIMTVPYDMLAAANAGSVTDTDFDAGTCGGNFYNRTIDGVGTVRTCWQIQPAGVNLLFITVRSEVTGPFSRMTQARFTTFRALNGTVPAVAPVGP